MLFCSTVVPKMGTSPAAAAESASANNISVKSLGSDRDSSRSAEMWMEYVWPRKVWMTSRPTSRFLLPRSAFESSKGKHVVHTWEQEYENQVAEFSLRSEVSGKNHDFSVLVMTLKQSEVAG